MRNYSHITPEGTRDILFKECMVKKELEETLTRVFLHRGYNEVRTPGLEYYDVFCLPDAAIAQQEMYKTTDNNGRLMVFRPDSTLPIARMVAARLKNAQQPIRLFYNQPVYRNCPDFSGRNKEISQMGVELVGANGLRADVEIITMVLESLSGFEEDFRLEIGHAGIFKAFAEQLPVSNTQKEDIRVTIENKNYAALDEQLSGLKQDEAVNAIKHLPRMFGGEEALKEAKSYCRDAKTKRILSYLKELYETLTRLGYGERVLVDLGLVQRNDYYTGVVFSAYIRDFGNAVISGGRYNTLLEKFGADMPAMGFSVDTDSIAEVMLSRNLSANLSANHSIIHAQPGLEIEVQSLIGKRIKAGEICETSFFGTLEECIAHAEKLKIPKVLHLLSADEIEQYDIIKDER